MGMHAGPRISTNNLVYTIQPGVDTRFMTTAGTVVEKGASTSISTGYFKTVHSAEDPGIDKTAYIHNLDNSLYVKNSSIYTVSMWIKIKGFPTHPFNNNSVRSKRMSIARLNYSYLNNLSKYVDGYLEFGAMAPFYFRSDNSTTPYKRVFNPLSFGVCFWTGKQRHSIVTDYKFAIDTWYNLTIEILDADTNSYTVKFYVNGTAENTVKTNGIAWLDRGNKTRNGSSTSSARGKRRTGIIARTNPIAFPDFRSNPTYSIIGSSITHFLSFKSSNSINFSKLNHISYGVMSKFWNNNFTDGGNGGLPGINIGSGSSIINQKHRKNFHQYNSRIEYGQLFILDSIFDDSIYNSFKYLYSS